MHVINTVMLSSQKKNATFIGIYRYIYNDKNLKKIYFNAINTFQN